MLSTTRNPLDRLQHFFVADVMTRGVAKIPSSATMDEAAEILGAAAATGAPVVDDAGRCIGVLSATDYLKFETSRGVGVDYSHVACDAVNGPHLKWNSVHRFMSTGVQSVPADAPLMYAAHVMCVEHIHRLIVLDERGAPMGILSTIDVVSALVSAFEECRQLKFT